MKGRLSQLSVRSDEEVDELRGMLSGLQCARVVLFVDSNRCRTEIERLGELEREAGVATLKKVKREAGP